MCRGVGCLNQCNKIALHGKTAENRNASTFHREWHTERGDAATNGFAKPAVPLIQEVEVNKHQRQDGSNYDDGTDVPIPIPKNFPKIDDKEACGYYDSNDETPEVAYSQSLDCIEGVSVDSFFAWNPTLTLPRMLVESVLV